MSIISFCRIHFAEGLRYSLVADSDHLSQRRGSGNIKETFNKVYLAGVTMISQTVNEVCEAIEEAMVILGRGGGRLQGKVLNSLIISINIISSSSKHPI